MTENGSEPDPWAPLGEERVRAMARHAGVADADFSSHGELTDILNARTLLDGLVVQEKGKPLKHEFLGDDRRDEYLRGLDRHLEDEARRAPARHLRSGKSLDQAVRLLLAALIDPDVDPKFPILRKIVFEKRGKGRPSNVVAHLHVARRLASKHREGMRVEDAIAVVADEVQLGYEAVLKIWKRHRHAVRSGDSSPRKRVRK